MGPNSGMYPTHSPLSLLIPPPKKKIKRLLLTSKPPHTPGPLAPPSFPSRIPRDLILHPRTMALIPRILRCECLDFGNYRLGCRVFRSKCHRPPGGKSGDEEEGIVYSTYSRLTFVRFLWAVFFLHLASFPAWKTVDFKYTCTIYIHISNL